MIEQILLSKKDKIYKRSDLTEEDIRILDEFFHYFDEEIHNLEPHSRLDGSAYKRIASSLQMDSKIKDLTSLCADYASKPDSIEFQNAEADFYDAVVRLRATLRNANTSSEES